MKKLFLYILLFAGMNAMPVTSFAKKIPVTDTLVETVRQNNFDANLDELVRYQEKRRAKEKKAAMIRIGIGVAFLVVLVIGLNRRRKK